MPLGRVAGDRIARVAYVQDATARAIHGIESTSGYPYGAPTGSVAASDVQAVFGRLQRIDSTLAAMNVYLPAIAAKDIGKSVGVVNLSSAPKQVTFISRGAVIDGAAKWTTAAPHGIYLLVAASTSLWVVHA